MTQTKPTDTPEKKKFTAVVSTLQWEELSTEELIVSDYQKELIFA